MHPKHYKNSKKQGKSQCHFINTINFPIRLPYTGKAFVNPVNDPAERRYIRQGHYSRKE
jgi:hypothetical protein